jgi:hypothetical protein
MNTNELFLMFLVAVLVLVSGYEVWGWYVRQKVKE